MFNLVNLVTAFANDTKEPETFMLIKEAIVTQNLNLLESIIDTLQDIFNIGPDDEITTTTTTTAMITTSTATPTTTTTPTDTTTTTPWAPSLPCGNLTDSHVPEMNSNVKKKQLMNHLSMYMHLKLVVQCSMTLVLETQLTMPGVPNALLGDTMQDVNLCSSTTELGCMITHGYLADNVGTVWDVSSDTCDPEGNLAVSAN